MFRFEFVPSRCFSSDRWRYCKSPKVIVGEAKARNRYLDSPRENSEPPIRSPPETEPTLPYSVLKLQSSRFMLAGEESCFFVPVAGFAIDKGSRWAFCFKGCCSPLRVLAGQASKQVSSASSSSCAFYSPTNIRLCCSISLSSFDSTYF